MAAYFFFRGGVTTDDLCMISGYPDLHIKPEEALMSDAVQLFKALADETRLRILNLIRHRELCVCQIVDVLGLGQSKVSRHLAYLRNAGLVNDRREGLWMYYSMAQPDGELGEQLLDLLNKAGDELPMADEDQQALAGLAQCSELCPEQSLSDKTISEKALPQILGQTP
jgi:ArsR family transcriptional regulator